MKNFIGKLESYFTSGPTDKQNKRRLGGLLVCVTAILLVIAILVTSVAGVVAIVSGIINNISNTDNNDDGPSTNSHLVETTLEEVLAKVNTNKYGPLSSPANENLAETSYTTLRQTNRPKLPSGENLYRCQSADNFALQNDAFAAFNAMATEFYNKKGLATLWVKAAYSTSGSNVEPYSNAYAIMLDYSVNGDASNGSIYGVEAYSWIYENAHLYGFIRVSNDEGEQNVFRYVGLAHAKNIYNKQKKADTFYTLDAYLEELKATTPTNTISIKGVAKALGDKNTTTYYSYYMPTDSATFWLPNDLKYGCTVDNVGSGYIVTYWKL